MINRRLLAKVMITLLIVASLSVLTVYGLPILLQSKILSLIQQETGRKASLDKVQFTLAPLSIQLQNFSIPETNGKPFANFASLTLKINVWQSLKQSVLVVDQLTLIKPIVHFVKQKNGKFNVEHLFKTPENRQSTQLALPITVSNLSLSAGKLTWQDSPIKETIQPINLTIDNFSTDINKKFQLNLQLSLESGGQLDWQAETSLNPVQSTGHIKLNNLKLQHLLTLTSAASPSLSLSGDEIFNTDYKISYTNTHFTFTADKAKIELRNFHYAENNIVVKTAHFTHESDIKISFAKNTWLLTANKSKMSLRDFEFSDSTSNKMLLQIPSLTHETDFKAQSTQQHWQLSANKTKINGHDLKFAYANAAFKIPTLALETRIDSSFPDNVQVNTQQGKLNSQQFQLFEKNQDKPLLAIPDLAVNGIDFNLDKQTLSIESVLAKEAYFSTWLNDKGVANYQILFPAAKIEEKPMTATAKSTPWAIQVKQINLAHCATTFTDQTQKPPVVISLNPIDFKLTDYSNKTGAKLPFQLNTDINKTGSIQLNGDTIIEPFSTQLAIDAKGIDLEPFQPYTEKFARLDIIDGQFATHGKLAIALHENTPLDLKFMGDSSINNFITRDKKRHKDFITWKKLTLNTLNVDLQKNRYTASALIIDKPYARVTIKKDKTINFSDIFIIEQAPSKASKHTAVTQPAPYFKLTKAQIIDGSSDFSDNSLILPFSTQIKSLDGGAYDISSDQKSTIKVSLKGNAYDLAPVDIDGNISPYLGDYDLSLNFKEMPMPLISPYMVEFAGYKVEKGKMSLKLKYKVVDGELTASNNILIDQFELGEKVENPKAVSLPLELAVALLKDSDGKIKIDVPITGSLDDPQFSLGAIISDALATAITKVVASPFHAIASLLDGNEEQLSSISFSAGSAVLDNKQQEKLTALAKLLKERSALILDIKGAAFQNQDWPAMKEAALYDLLKNMRADEINQQNGGKKILAEYVELSDKDYKRLLAQLFIEKFPKLAKKSLLGTPELIDGKGDFYEVAKQQLSASLKREQPRLKQLAIQRARAIASYLVQKGNVSNEQIFILDPAIDPKRDNNDIASVLSLKTN